MLDVVTRTLIVKPLGVDGYELDTDLNVAWAARGENRTNVQILRVDGRS